MKHRKSEDLERRNAPFLSLNVLKLEKILGKICPLGSFEFLDEEYMP